MTTFCTFCDTKAISVFVDVDPTYVDKVVVRQKTTIPVCATCETAFESGQNHKNATSEEIEDYEGI